MARAWTRRSIEEIFWELFRKYGKKDETSSDNDCAVAHEPRATYDTYNGYKLVSFYVQPETHRTPSVPELIIHNENLDQDVTVYWNMSSSFIQGHIGCIFIPRHDDGKFTAYGENKLPIFDYTIQLSNFNFTRYWLICPEEGKIYHLTSSTEHPLYYYGLTNLKSANCSPTTITRTDAIATFTPQVLVLNGDMSTSSSMVYKLDNNSTIQEKLTDDTNKSEVLLASSYEWPDDKVKTLAQIYITSIDWEIEELAIDISRR